MGNIRACIFDLDGTLLDTLTALWYCSMRSLRKEGLVPLPKDNYRYYVGDGSRVQVQRYLRDTDIDPDAKNADIPDPHDPASLDYYYKSYMRELELYSDYEVRPYDGITEALKALKQEGIRLAVFSNKPDQATQKLIPEYFGDVFDMVLGQREGIPKKPDPAGALMIAEGFGLNPSEVMYLGDTNTDMRTGKAAGMYTVGVLWGFRDRHELEENHADVIISHPAEIPGLVRNPMY